MADITAISSLGDGTDLTAAQVTEILNKIDIDIYNVVQTKYDGANYTEFGDAGHKFEGSTYLTTLLELRKHYQEILDSMPTIGISIYDDPSL